MSIYHWILLVAVVMANTFWAGLCIGKKQIPQGIMCGLTSLAVVGMILVINH